MTAEQKTAVTNLRKQGYGYMKIAKQLDLTVSSVKSFCQRNQIDNGIENIAVQTDVIQKKEPEIKIVAPSKEESGNLENVCKFCGIPIAQREHAKRKLFCSTKCRQTWWNAHLDQVDKKAVYAFTCQTCGKPFEAYGDKERKYCSRDCYIKGRFGGGEAKI